MERNLLLKYLDEIHPLSESLKIFLLHRLRILRISKNDVLYNQGEILQMVYFVINGLLVSYTHIEERKQITAFYKEQDFLIEHRSFHIHQKSHCTVFAEENSYLLGLHYRDLISMYQLYPESNYIARFLLEYSHCLKDQHTALLLYLNRSVRYTKFKELMPWALSRLKLGQIASFLNMAPETLSRIRNTAIS
ncbi:Crp/Fnr family transcriptional regulator [Pseudopedobacter beijingensis]|uniref:Crp/Fnr family transcriptional regulator n=1 Tax=Pseudopedobacter beijingensis TaxID=1207056 RepID=A0ABW4IF03_9SPHI